MLDSDYRPGETYTERFNRIMGIPPRPEGMVDCRACRGTGTITDRGGQLAYGDPLESRVYVCSSCGGNGWCKPLFE